MEMKVVLGDRILQKSTELTNNDQNWTDCK